MPTVVRVQNPGFFQVPEFVGLIDRALAVAPGIIAPYADAPEEYTKIVINPLFGVFAGVEKGLLKALCIVALPQGKLMPIPQVWVFYNEGSRKLKDLLLKESLAFGVERGYMHFWAINASGRSDAAWNKVFEGAGKPKKVGSVLEFTIGG
jgi:hypothetical protein